jgi:hypothetical protein
LTLIAALRAKVAETGADDENWKPIMRRQILRAAGARAEPNSWAAASQSRGKDSWRSAAWMYGRPVYRQPPMDLIVGLRRDMDVPIHFEGMLHVWLYQ